MENFSVLKKFRNAAFWATVVGLIILALICFFAGQHTKFENYTYGSIACGFIFVVMTITADFKQDSRADDFWWGIGAVLFLFLGLILIFALAATKSILSPWIILVVLCSSVSLVLRILLLVSFIGWIKTFKPAGKSH